MRKAGLIAVAAGLVLIAGCGDDKVEGSPSTPTNGEAAIWDPCDGGIPNDALSAAGYDPATQKKDVAGVKFDGWKMCEWKGGQFAIGVMSNDKTLADLPKNTSFRDFQTTSIAGREARTFHLVGFNDDAICEVAVGTPYGSAIFVGSPLNFADHGLDVCGEATRSATAFEKYVPSS